MAASSISLKLLIDTQAKKVIFGEADNTCVDFLFHILSLPVATVIRLLRKQGMVGSMANLYGSIETLNESYLQPNKNKSIVLKPSVSQPYRLSVPLLMNDAKLPQRRVYRCSNGYSHSYYADDAGAVCPSCNHTMTSEMSYVAPKGQQDCNEGGFVKSLVTYMVTDDLVIEPMSTISSIDLVNKFKVKDVGSLEKKVVHLGHDEAISVLKASLQSDTVLTDVFLKGK